VLRLLTVRLLLKTAMGTLTARGKSTHPRLFVSGRYLVNVIRVARSAPIHLLLMLGDATVATGLIRYGTALVIWHAHASRDWVPIIVELHLGRRRGHSAPVVAIVATLGTAGARCVRTAIILRLWLLLLLLAELTLLALIVAIFTRLALLSCVA